MAGILDGVDRRTQLAGHNRLELLLFRLRRKQRYGINVFKVQEVIQCPRLTQVPHSHPAVRGVANLRGKTITLVDLGMAIGQAPLADITDAYVIITEYNRSTQGFLVNGVDRIVNLNWDQIKPPPRGTGSNYMTAVVNVDNELVEIIDVEKVLSEIMVINNEVSHTLIQEKMDETDANRIHHILIVDDSSVARNQIKRTVDQLGFESTIARNGKEAWDLLRGWAKDGVDIEKKISLVISDVEMPEMDGYTLTTSIRNDPDLKNLYVILHTSLSGVFNNALVEKVGANRFIAKFNPNELARAILDHIEKIH
jgi:two-component system, chemotaxis family, chemotaxis protein CheV